MGFLDNVLGGALWGAGGNSTVAGGLLGANGGGGAHGNPFPDYLAKNAGTYQPGGSANSFSSWLSGLPTPQQLAPMNAPLQKTGIGPNLVPAMWQAFAPYGESLINQGADARLRSSLAGIGNSRRNFEQTLLSQYQAAGLDPTFARAQLAESLPQVGQQAETERGNIESDRLDQLFGLSSGIQNALAESYAGDRGLNVSAYFGGKGLDASAKAAKLSALSSGAGSLASLLAMA